MGVATAIAAFATLLACRWVGGEKPWSFANAARGAVAAVSLAWMHVAVRAMEREAVGEALRQLPELPEMQEIHEPKHVGVLGPHLIEDWRPEDKTFWESTGRRIARRNLQQALRSHQSLQLVPGASLIRRRSVR